MSLNILIAEDEPDCLRLFARSMELFGGEVSGFSTCQEGMLEIIKNSNYDLVLTDLNQEPYSGVDLSRLARALCKRPYIVVCTGNPTGALAKKAKLTADLVISKTDYVSQYRQIYSSAEERVKQVKAD